MFAFRTVLVILLWHNAHESFSCALAAHLAAMSTERLNAGVRLVVAQW